MNIVSVADAVSSLDKFIIEVIFKGDALIVSANQYEVDMTVEDGVRTVA